VTTTVHIFSLHAVRADDADACIWIRGAFGETVSVTFDNAEQVAEFRAALAIASSKLEEVV
jgi:hypothetical protein